MAEDRNIKQPSHHSHIPIAGIKEFLYWPMNTQSESSFPNLGLDHGKGQQQQALFQKWLQKNRDEWKAHCIGSVCYATIAYNKYVCECFVLFQVFYRGGFPFHITSIDISTHTVLSHIWPIKSDCIWLELFNLCPLGLLNSLEISNSQWKLHLFSCNEALKPLIISLQDKFTTCTFLR